MCVVKTGAYFCFQHDSSCQVPAKVASSPPLVFPTLRCKLLLSSALSLFKAVKYSLPPSHLFQTWTLLRSSFRCDDVALGKHKWKWKLKHTCFSSRYLVASCVCPGGGSLKLLCFFSFCFKYCFLLEREVRGVCVQRHLQVPVHSGPSNCPTALGLPTTLACCLVFLRALLNL